MRDADAMVLGKKTYDIFASSWPSMTGELADRMNGIQKHVITTTTGQLDWSNSKAIEDDLVEAVSVLKNQPGLDILVAGSCSVVQTIAELGLVDEYRLFMCSVILGAGQWLFTPAFSKAQLDLAEATTFDSGALLLRYAV